MKIKQYIPHILLVFCAFVWGVGFTAQDAIEGLGAFTIGTVRNFVATLFLIIVVIVFDRIRGARRLVSRRGIDITRVELLGGVLCGIALAAASSFQQLGISAGTDGGKAAFITSLYVVLVPIFALFLKKRAPINVWIGVALAAVGFYFLCIKQDFSVDVTDIPVMLCALVFPIHILIIDYFIPRGDALRIATIQCLTCGIIQLIFALIFERGVTPALIGANIFPLLFLGIGASGVAYTLQMIGQAGVNPSAASIIMSLESVFGVFGSLVFLGTTLSPREYIGCAIVFVAVVISQIDFTAIIKHRKISSTQSPDICTDKE